MAVARAAAPIGLAVGIIALSFAPARAQTPCAAGDAALGVSRTVEIDTTGGPRYGAQYPGNDFLKPGEVVLTFDDGPSRAKTPAILKALAAHCTKATFFIVGRMALVEPDLLREAARAGHTIGLHTWSHKKLTSITEAKAKEEVELGHSVVEKSLGVPVAPFFRFPYLAAPHSTLAYLGQRNMATIGIDVDSKDFTTHKPDVMMQNVLAQLKVRGKGIILFHDIQASTAAGLMALLDELKKRGFKVVHLTAAKSVSTLADYDLRAEQLIAKRQVATAHGEVHKAPVFGPDSPAGAEAIEPEELPWLREQKPEVAGPPAPPDLAGPPEAPSPVAAKPKKPWWQLF